MFNADVLTELAHAILQVLHVYGRNVPAYVGHNLALYSPQVLRKRAGCNCVPKVGRKAP